jgi:chemotaxis protein MotB
MAKGKKGEGNTIVIKRIEEGGHRHHGGAWKVAYADFVTAMMAFFLLMWLINATTAEQRRGLADYFNPTTPISSSTTGSGLPFGGMTINSAGNLARDTGAVRLERGQRPVHSDLEDEEDEREVPPIMRPQGPLGREEGNTPLVVQMRPSLAPGSSAREGEFERRAGGSQGDNTARITDASLRLELARREQQAMEQVAEILRQAVSADPATADLARQLSVEVTPEGLRIQLIDADGRPMFASGNAQPNERTRALIRAVAVAAGRLPNPIHITGHTDSAPFRGDGRSNWELSAERANAARRMLLDAGVLEGRIRSVAGMADREPHLPEQPGAAGNRRVAITLLRQAEPQRAGGSVPR